MTDFLEDEREKRLSQFIKDNKKTLPKKLSCSLEEDYLWKLAALAAWSGKTKTECLRIAIDELLAKVDQARGAL